MSGDIETRWSGNGTQYRPRNKKTSRPFWNAINKYGWDNFEKEILENNLTFDEAIEGEIFYIAFFDATNKEKGYNLSRGGNGGRVYLEHPKGMLGKSQTTYQKETHKTWASNKDNNCMVNGQVSWGETHEHPRGMKGKKQSEKQKAVARNNKYSCKKVIATLPNGETKNFNSIKECAEHFNVSKDPVISRLLKTNKPYKCSPNTRVNREKLEAIEGLVLNFES